MDHFSEAVRVALLHALQDPQVREHLRDLLGQPAPQPPASGRKLTTKAMAARCHRTANALHALAQRHPELRLCASPPPGEDGGRRLIWDEDRAVAWFASIGEAL